VEKMDSINDDEAHAVGVRSVGHFPRYDIPFLWSGNNDLRLCDLLLGHLGVASKLANFDTKDLESSCEVSAISRTKPFIGAT